MRQESLSAGSSRGADRVSYLDIMREYARQPIATTRWNDAFAAANPGNARPGATSPDKAVPEVPGRCRGTGHRFLAPHDVAPSLGPGHG